MTLELAREDRDADVDADADADADDFMGVPTVLFCKRS